MASLASRHLVWACCVVIPLTFSSPAPGYCRKTTCSTVVDPPEDCLTSDERAGAMAHGVESGCDTRGIPLFWARSCLSFSAQYEGSPKLGILGSELEQAIRESFDQWQLAPCEGGGTPNLRVDTYPQVACKQQQYNPSAANQNVWFFQDEHWPYEDERADDIAVTTNVFSRTTGEIYDVDVELNSADHEFVLDGSEKGHDLVDLRSIVQHESGHVLGLSDLFIANGADSSLMFGDYPGGTGWQELDADAINGICDTYPPTDTPDTACGAQPRHGFSPECAPTDGCTIALGRGPASPRWRIAGWLAPFLFLSTWRKRFRIVRCTTVTAVNWPKNSPETVRGRGHRATDVHGAAMDAREASR